jgi:hypothetical protein
MYQTSIETLMKRVRIENDCWLWQGPTVGRGYGKVGFRGKTARAHRVMWELANGEIPAGLYVCHKCDIPSCINPDHLFLGTADENNKDMAQKGRSASGARNARVLYPEKYPRGDQHYSRTNPERLARGDKHGTHLHPERLRRGDNHPSRLHPENLPRGKNHWSHTNPDSVARGEKSGFAKVTNSQVIQIREMYKEGVSSKKIAQMFGISPINVWKIATYRSWRHIK